MTTTRIVIIGGGPAGYEAALAGAKSGADVTVVEDRGMGGACVIDDCVPSKSFISATGIRTDMRRADDMGLGSNYDPNVFDYADVNRRVRDLARAQSNDVNAQMARAGVTVVRGRGRIDDSAPGYAFHYVTVELAEPDSDGSTERTIKADLVLVATGASPRILPGAKPDGERILTWRQVYDLTELPEHLIVVGSGVTGAEFVSAFTELGVKVTMVASRDRVLPHEDADAADVLETVLSERGVSLVKDARVDVVERTEDGGVRVVTGDGREITGSHALMTVGSVPNTKDLGLDRLGMEMERSGHIKVDRVSRTSVPGIYAAGDCTNLFPLASVAAMQGRVAMYHALGEGVSPIRLRTVSTAVFTRPEIATVGVSHRQVLEGEVSARVEVFPLGGNPRAKMRSLRHGFVKLFCRRNSGIVIGGVVVAPIASELILPIAMAVTNRLTVEDIANTFSVYPSLSGSVTEAARKLVQPDDLQ
ncbi:NAD(P)H-quinone dehydrogenase [Corynebacterium bovis]|uniref:NAD(P)H-quinone dehydrogenase n=2 Tax=Corynebacterium bovis TaxID=36808 RepID=UPI00244848DE|nr:NAD(P)H-quinone dehydrogenase [Corynebacterium bovis]MDH2455555.1 NAD(P)H-quinone dehydrogenase [Corynebacterium bovis]